MFEIDKKNVGAIVHSFLNLSGLVRPKTVNRFIQVIRAAGDEGLELLLIGCVSMARPKTFRGDNDVLFMNNNEFKRVENVTDGMSFTSYRKEARKVIRARMRKTARSGIIFEAISSTIVTLPKS